MVRKAPIVVYKHDGCGGCKIVLPLIKKYAKKNKIPVRVVDVNKCRTKKCNELGYVPYIEYQGKEVKTSEQLAAILHLPKKAT